MVLVAAGEEPGAINGNAMIDKKFSKCNYFTHKRS